MKIWSINDVCIAFPCSIFHLVLLGLFIAFLTFHSPLYPQGSFFFWVRVSIFIIFILCSFVYATDLYPLFQKNSLCTIKNHANVCCVQFSPHSTHMLAFTSADYKTYCYDLRNVSIPWCVLAGHEKAVSYARFLDAGTLVSASTDNTLKVWDLKKTSSNSLSRDACILTHKGHTNEKVGWCLSHNWTLFS